MRPPGLAHPLRVHQPQSLGTQIGIALVYADGRVRERTRGTNAHSDAFGGDAERPDVARVRYFIPRYYDKRFWNIVTESPQALRQTYLWMVGEKQAKPEEGVTVLMVDQYGAYRTESGTVASLFPRLFGEANPQSVLATLRNPRARTVAAGGLLLLLLLLLLPEDTPVLGPLAGGTRNLLSGFLPVLGRRAGTRYTPPSRKDEQRVAAVAVQRRFERRTSPTVIDGLVDIAALPPYPAHCLAGWSTAECVADIEQYNQVLMGATGMVAAPPLVRASDSPPLSVLQVAEALGQEVTTVAVREELPGAPGDFDYWGIPITLASGQPDATTAAVLATALGLAEGIPQGYLEWFGYIGDAPAATIKGEGTDLTLLGEAPAVPVEHQASFAEALQRWNQVAAEVWNYEDFVHFIKTHYPHLAGYVIATAVPLYFVRNAVAVTAWRFGQNLWWLLLVNYWKYLPPSRCPPYLCPPLPYPG